MVTPTPNTLSPAIALTISVYFPRDLPLISPIPQDTRANGLTIALSYYNHKSMRLSQAFDKDIQKEIGYGFVLHVLISFTHHIIVAKIAPHGIVPQHTINEQVEIINKEQVTHDQY